MREPDHVTGKLTRSHSFEHKIRWDYALLAVLGLYVATKIAPKLATTSSDSDEVTVEQTGPIDTVAP